MPSSIGSAPAARNRPASSALRNSNIRISSRCRIITCASHRCAALHLVAIEGLTFAEAADALDIPIGTLMSRLGRARAALRALEENVPKRVAADAKPSLKLVGGSDGTSP